MFYCNRQGSFSEVPLTPFCGSSQVLNFGVGIHLSQGGTLSREDPLTTIPNLATKNSTHLSSQCYRPGVQPSMTGTLLRSHLEALEKPVFKLRLLAKLFLAVVGPSNFWLAVSS